jgi:hypothetical protein
VTPFYFLANNIGLRLLEPAIKAALLPAVNGTALQAAKKTFQNIVIPSEARNLSFFLWGQIEERFLAPLGMTK